MQIKSIMKNGLSEGWKSRGIVRRTLAPLEVGCPVDDTAGVAVISCGVAVTGLASWMGRVALHTQVPLHLCFAADIRSSHCMHFKLSVLGTKMVSHIGMPAVPALPVLGSSEAAGATGFSCLPA